MNAAKDARIGDFRNRVRETRKRTSARTRIRGDAKRCVLSKRGGEDERGRTTHRGMARRILGMRWSAGRKKVLTADRGKPRRALLGTRRHSLAADHRCIRKEPLATGALATQVGSASAGVRPVRIAVMGRQKT